MVATARSYGLLAYKIPSDIKSILREIDAGNPVLVMQNLSVSWWPRWHYAVIVGFDLKDSIFILRSGTTRRHKVDFYTFQNTWNKADNWAYVLVDPGSMPASAEALGYIRASHDLFQAGLQQEAILAFRQGAVAWPEKSIVQMALANAEYQLGNYEAAYDALLNELSFHANNASAWNNLAYTLLRRACYSEAQEAVQCAQKLAPDDENIQQSLTEVMAKQDENTRQCPIPSCPM
jgi:tetratricopeptide (TPR) repeat protein